MGSTSAAAHTTPSHVAHCAEPAALPEPRAQGMHSKEPRAERLPGGQTRHADAPAVELKLPAAQGVHAAGPSVKVPPGQVAAVKLHEFEPSPLYAPTGQGAQKDLLVAPKVAPKVPAAHGVHSWPGMELYVPGKQGRQDAGALE